MGGLPMLMPRVSVASRRGARIDRLGWRAGTCIEAHGIRFGVRSNDPGLLQQLAPFLPPGWRTSRSPVVDEVFSLWLAPGRGGRRPARVCRGDGRSVPVASLDRALAILESEMRTAIAVSARDRVFVHAGVVGWRGRAILLPGQSRSGKTTLVGELVRAGASYLSDEFAPLDERGRVHPFAKPLTVRGPNGCDLHARRVNAAELGSACFARPLPIGLVALTRFQPGAAWRPRALTPGQAVLGLLAHTVPARLRPEACLDVLSRAVAGAIGLGGPRGDAAETARLLLRALEEAP
jgi:hypothetical protein